AGLRGVHARVDVPRVRQRANRSGAGGEAAQGSPCPGAGEPGRGRSRVDTRSTGCRGGAVKRRGSSSLLAVLLMAGCAVADAEQAPPADGPPPFAHCAELTAPPAQAAGAANADDAVTSELPDVELPCFVDGQPVRV